jgi:hypothetical protein
LEASSLISLMEDMELAVFDDLAGGAAEDRERVEVFAARIGLPALTAFDLGARGAFFTASELRTAATASEDGLVFVEADRETFGAGEAEDFVGTTEALRDGAGGVAADFGEAEDIGGRDVAAGADVVGFFNAGAATFGTALAVTLEPEVGLTVPAPNVPELII